MPSVSSYIGGDITSEVYVSKLREESGLALLIDIGTNGEIVLSEDRSMVACSAAAGPAFEGYGLHHRCRATDGAIEPIAFDGKNRLRTGIIGKQKVSGICGTVMIDVIELDLHDAFQQVDINALSLPGGKQGSDELSQPVE